MDPQFLVVVRASPFREHTHRLLESIVSQDAGDLVRTTVLRHRHTGGRPEFGTDAVKEVPVEPDWLAQVQTLAKASGCRWVVLPSSGDRYLPGAFEAIARHGAGRACSLVAPCRILRDGRPHRVGPAPFRFDYFALLSGFSYIAPGATFIHVDQLLDGGGFHPRFPNALVYKLLLVHGAAHGVDWLEEPVLETVADPFPGIPVEVSVSYALEALSAALDHNPGFLAPGATLGLAATLAQHLEPMREFGYYDEELVLAIGSVGPRLRDRYQEYIGLAPVSPGGGQTDPKGTGLSAFSEAAPHGVRRARPGRLQARIRAIAPRPIWQALRRGKRVWTALRTPLE